ncbi:MAG: FAD:protein FMN transferase, partial [Planctomycetes bacterium]|nr:FAD:protein FMN transferase [Planctomycetota bacterium]
MNRTLRAAITIVAIVTAIVVIRISTQPDVYSADSPFRQVMGTFARATAVSNSEKTAQLCVDAAFAELTGVDDMMSDYKADSQLSQVNKNAFDEPVKVSGALMKVLLAAIDYSKQTGGAFDITVGPVVDLWRQAEKDGQKPTDEQLAAAKAK